MTTNVSGSGIATMSDSSIALKPVIDEPSKPMPSSSAPSSSSGVIAKLFRCPSRSVNQRSIDSMPSVLHFASTACPGLLARRRPVLRLDLFRHLSPPENEKAPSAVTSAPEASSPSDSRSIAQYAVAVIAELERPELEAYADAFRASPELCEVAEIGGATCTVLRRLEERSFNRVLGLTSTGPLDEIAAFFGDAPWWVSDSHGLGPELEERGFVHDYGWMKFSRGTAPRQAQSDLRVVRIGEGAAADFAGVVVGGFGMPEWTRPLAANVVGRPGWSCYVAYDGETAAGAGALFVHGVPGAEVREVGWLGLGATLPDFRGRGAQSAILAARIEDARKQGCATVTTETGQRVDDRPSNSYRNIVRAGFRERGVRPNYRAT